MNSLETLQVGGHSSMFQYDRETLCKVLDLDELNFYQTMPEFLKTFAPEFRGKNMFLQVKDDRKTSLMFVRSTRNFRNDLGKYSVE